MHRKKVLPTQFLATPVQIQDVTKSFIRESALAGSPPGMISEKHLELFEPLNEVSIQDRHGPGGLLIARKFSDEEFPMDEKTAAMIDKKETLAKVNPH